MERIKLQRESRNRYIVAWTRFIKTYANKKSEIFCFFEGPDDPKYYGARLDSVFNQKNTVFLISKGKEAVLKIRSLWRDSEEYKHANILLFVDKDFDVSHPEDPSLYVTPCYAIENLYVDTGVIQKLLRDEFFENEGEEEEEILRLWEITLDQFVTTMETLNFWLWKQRQMELSGSCHRADLNNLNISQYLKIEIGAVESKLSQEIISKIFPESYQITEADIAEARAYFLNKDRKLSFRGKWLFECLRLFLERLAAD